MWRPPFKISESATDVKTLAAFTLNSNISTMWLSFPEANVFVHTCAGKHVTITVPSALE